VSGDFLHVVHYQRLDQSSVFLRIALKRGIVMSDEAVKESQPAPDFTLPAIGDADVIKDGKVALQDLKGYDVVLYFYPKED
jgi:hypothetical protein